VLRQFHMLLPRTDILALEGVCDPSEHVKPPAGRRPRAAYAYLHNSSNAVELDGEQCFVHPEVAHDFGIVKPDDLVAEMVKLTVGEGAKPGSKPGDPPTHWSQKAGQSNVKSLDGNMVHYHKSGGSKPNKWCSKHNNADACDADFPMPASERTIVGPDRRVLYHREAHEVWVVPYNPWLLLYFRACVARV
jgi:hypothetical protein